MAIRDLLPSIWRKDATPVRREEESPFHTIQQEMNRMFDDFFKGFDVAPFRDSHEPFFGAIHPAVDIRENGKEIVVTAELPGLEEKDFEVLIADDALTIKGEKKETKEDKGKGYYHTERSYGYFSRVIPLPPGIDPQAVDAKYKKGILTVKLPKAEEAKSKAKRISINPE